MTGDTAEHVPPDGRSSYRPCSSCGRKRSCLWADDAWVCQACGDEWYPDHGPEYAAPASDESNAPSDLVESVYEEAALLRQLVAYADAMYAENAAKAQAESDATYQAEFGHSGPRLAGPLGGAGRTYVLYRHRIGRRVGLPDAASALGQRAEAKSSEEAT